jgi:alpha-tubulin suppressor-like RCC1 family protein
MNVFDSLIKSGLRLALTCEVCFTIFAGGVSASAATGYALMAMGNNDTSQLGMEEMGISIENIYINPVVTDTNVTDISAGGTFSLFCSPEGRMHGMGDRVKSKGAGHNVIASYVNDYDAGYDHGLLVFYDGTPSGTLYSFGDNTYGQLGAGFVGKDESEEAKAIEDSGKIVVYTIARNVKTVSAGNNHSLYVTAENKLYGMGSSFYGQLGQGDQLSHAVPVEIASNVIAAEAGALHSLYLTTTGVLYAMGSNSNGELGDGSRIDRRSPVKIASNVAAISAGDSFSMYITTSGDLYGMGSNAYGQLGLGDVARVTKPTLVAKDVTLVSCGGKHTVFITKDEKLHGMGDNFMGQLGDGTCVNRTTPIEIDYRVKSASAGADFTLYLKPNVSIFTPTNELKGKWSDWGWIHDGSFPWVWSYNYEMWFYVYDGIFAYAKNGYWIAYYNQDGSDYGWGYVYPQAGWWCITSDGKSHWLDFGDPIPTVKK